MHPAPAARRSFPPSQVTQVKALACARPQEVGQPLARFSVQDLTRAAGAAGRAGPSYSTVWRWLHQAALRPWFQRQWLFPQDPRLLEKATPVLELYHGRWEGQALGPREWVLCADELTNLRPLARHRVALPPAAGRAGRYEFSHDQPRERRVYLALREVPTGYVYGEVGPVNGKAPFLDLLTHYLQRPHTAAAERLFLILDNGAAHHPRTTPARLAALDGRLTAVYLPAHSSWLNQMELYFALLKRKALTPLDLPTAAALEARIAAFEAAYNQQPAAFRWHYTVADLRQYLQRLTAHGVWPPPPSQRDRRHDRR